MRSSKICNDYLWVANLASVGDATSMCYNEMVVVELGETGTQPSYAGFGLAADGVVSYTVTYLVYCCRIDESLT